MWNLKFRWGNKLQLMIIYSLESSAPFELRALITTEKLLSMLTTRSRYDGNSCGVPPQRIEQHFNTHDITHVITFHSFYYNLFLVAPIEPSTLLWAQLRHTHYTYMLHICITHIFTLVASIGSQWLRKCCSITGIYPLLNSISLTNVSQYLLPMCITPL